MTFPGGVVDFPLVRPKFGEPWVLWFLVIPLLLLGWTWASRWLMPGRRVVLPLDGAEGGSGWRAWACIATAESIPALILACAILVLAGPQTNGPPVEKHSLTNIQFCVDVSGSMGARFGEGTRYDAAMKAVDVLLDYRKGDAFGMTFFGGNFIHWVPLTSDPSAIKCSTPFMRPEIRPSEYGGTLIAKALKGCKEELSRREEGDRMIILVTDGFSSDLPGAEIEIVKAMREANITVFTVVIGGDPIQDEVATTCRGTGGEAFMAGDPEALVAVFRQIDRMKQAKIQATIVETIDYFQPFALAGLVLAFIYALTLFGLRYTPW